MSISIGVRNVNGTVSLKVAGPMMTRQKSDSNTPDNVNPYILITDTYEL
jgi:hypothetical protein